MASVSTLEKWDPCRYWAAENVKFYQAPKTSWVRYHVEATSEFIFSPRVYSSMTVWKLPFRLQPSLVLIL